MRFGIGLTLLTSLCASGTAWAQAALDDAGKPIPTTDPNAAPPTAPAPAPDKPEYGADLRLRGVFAPQGIVELFVERAAGGVGEAGFGIDLVRRRGNVELQLGFEYEHVQPTEGVYIQKGKTPGTDTVDYIDSPAQAGSTFGWFTIEFTFLNHARLGTDYVWLRYGGGAGLGIITGDIKRIDTACAAGATVQNPEPGCIPQGTTHNGQQGQGTITPDNAGDPEPGKYDTPPVFPVVNAILGVQIRPTKKAVVNIEGGLRFPLFFFGISAGYFF